MNIPGLDGPSFGRAGGGAVGVDEQQEAEEEEKAQREWKKEVESGKKKVKFTPSSSSLSSSAPITCDVLLFGCGMMGASFLTLISQNATEEIGRFTLTSNDDAKKSSATFNNNTPTENGALLLTRSSAAPNIIFAFNYLRLTAPEYFDLTQAVFQQITPKTVFLFDTIPQGAYISSIRPLPSPPIIRRLQTTNLQSLKSTITELESPNLVFGYSASVLTECEVRHIPTQLFVSVESRHYVVECYLAFEEAFASIQSSTPELTSLQAAMAASLEATKTASDAIKFKAYKTAISNLQVRYGYTAGSDSSIRETAAQVQKDHRDAMFY